MDEEACPVCGKDLTPVDVESYTLSHWTPNPDVEHGGNTGLVQMYCSIDHLRLDLTGTFKAYKTTTGM